MRIIRQLIAQRHLAGLVCAAALLVKLLVPTGYMIANEAGRFAIVICPSATPAVASSTLPAMHAGMAGHGGHEAHGQAAENADHHGKQEHSKPELPCAFAGLSGQALAAADPIQLAGLIVFILALGWAATLASAPAHPPYLRPPLRGPPVTA